MNPYNSAFFGLFQNLYLVAKERYGDADAISLFTTVMEKGLKAAYADDFVKGSIDSFIEAVGNRDNNVGLEVKFVKDVNDTLVYEFYTDPFPLLKEEIQSATLDATYMNFKVKHLLGDDWSYSTAKHLWNGDECTQHIIKKNTQ